MTFIGSRTLRVCAFVAAFFALALPETVVAAPVQSDAAGSSREPFGIERLAQSEGRLREKWHDILRQWNDEKGVLAACRDNPVLCPDAAQAFMTVVESAKALDGRARIGEINRAINLAIKPVSDLIAHGSTDVWSSPLDTFARRTGDCEDYAIAKYAALLEANIAPENLRLLIVRDSVRDEDHAIVAVKHDDGWLVLDNHRLLMLADSQLSRYTPLFVLDGRDAGYRAIAAVEADASTPSAAEPASILDSAATPADPR